VFELGRLVKLVFCLTLIFMRGFYFKSTYDQKLLNLFPFADMRIDSFFGRIEGI